MKDNKDIPTNEKEDNLKFKVSLSSSEYNEYEKGKFENNPKNEGKEYAPAHDTARNLRLGILQKRSVGEYARVYNEESSAKEGRWLLRKGDIKGLNPQQIQGKYAIPSIPTHVSDVELEEDTLLIDSFASDNDHSSKAGGTQYLLLGGQQAEFKEGLPLSESIENDEKFSYEQLGANDSQPSNDNNTSRENEQPENREEGLSL